MEVEEEGQSNVSGLLDGEKETFGGPTDGRNLTEVHSSPATVCRLNPVSNRIFNT